MNKSISFLMVAFLTLVANAAMSQAQIRGAGSKVLGKYDRFDQPAQTRTAPMVSTPQTTMAQESAAARAFSYDATKPAPPCAATQPAPAAQATRQPTPSQPARRFSYDPGISVPRRGYAPSRGWQNGTRNAASKVLGQY